MRRRLVSGVTVVTVAVLTACGDDDPSRQTVVAAITADAVPARWAAFAGAADELVETVTAACESPSNGIPGAEVADAVTRTRAAWTALSPFWFGPVDERNARFVVDWPVDATQVDQLAADDSPVDQAAQREVVGADQRGLGAIDVLVDGPLDERRCAYALGSAALVADEARQLADDWARLGTELADGADAADETLADIVSQTVFATAMIADDADPTIATARIDGISWALLGTDGGAGGAGNAGGAEQTAGGIAPLLDDVVVERLRSDLARLRASPTEQTASALQTTIRTNVAGELGISVAFSDADGDG